MAYSYVVYTGNGATTQYTVSFPYIRKEHVKVYVNFVDTAYTWVNNTTVLLATAPANGVRVEVRRVTPANSPLVDFADGSTLVAADLDTANLQQLYLEQELDDQLKQTVSIDPATGLPSASGQRITNVGTPTQSTDAATKGYVDGFVSQTANIADSAVTTAKLADADLQTLAGAQAGAAAAFAALTAGEVATLDGLTSSTAELNILDGVTADANEINKLDGLTASTSELNQLQGKTISGTLTPGNTNDIPTSSAVNSWVANLINALGGFVAIANRNSFPTENPDPSDNAGTVVSIADAGGLVVNASGTATNAQTTGAVAVTITGFPAPFQSKTLPAGTGIQVQTTSTLNTYTYHKAIPTDADIAQLNDDANSFFTRYRVGAVNPTIDLDAGDLFFNTTIGKMLVYDGTTSSWEEIQSIGNFNINTISSSGGTGGGSASFNGTAYRFALSSPPLFAQQLLVSINGVIQKPNSGTSQPAEGFAIDGNDIIFSQAPAASSPFFIVTMGSTVNIGTPSDGAVSTAKIQDGAITPAKLSTGGPSWDASSNVTIAGNSGRLLVGTSTARSNYYSSVTPGGLQSEVGTLAIFQNSNNTTGAAHYIGKSRGTTANSNTVVQADDQLGAIVFFGADGTNVWPGAQITALVDGTPGANDMPGRLVFSTTADGASSPTERMRITHEGKTLFGTSTIDPGIGNSVVGCSVNTAGYGSFSRNDTALYLCRTASNGNIAQFFRGNTTVGTISVTTTTTTYNTSSDYRLKENVTAVTDGISRLQQLKPSRFNFIADLSTTVDGFIAHEVKTVVPEAITGEKDEVDDDGNPIYQGIDQSKLVPLLTAALQEAIGRIETLEATVEEWEAKAEEIRQRYPYPDAERARNELGQFVGDDPATPAVNEAWVDGSPQ